MKEQVTQGIHYETQDISKVEELTKLCAEKIPTCASNDCWAGGDTGGWFGIQ